jgi:YVTN family beta-propeller protein
MGIKIAMPLNLNEIHFEGFRFSVSERCLFRGEQLVALTPKEFEILAVLVEFRGKVVQKRELRDRVWPDNEDIDLSSLFHHMKSLRSKLGRRQDGPPYIETIPGRGYRLMVEVEPDESKESSQIRGGDRHGAADQPAEPVRAAARVSLEPNEASRNGFGKWLAGLAALIVLVGGAAIFFHRKSALAESPAAVSVLTSPEIGQGPRVVKLIEVKPQPSYALLGAEHDELFVSELGNDSVSIVDVKKDKVVDRVAVGHQPSTLVPSADRKKVFVAQEGGGVGVIDTAPIPFSLLRI